MRPVTTMVPGHLGTRLAVHRMGAGRPLVLLHATGFHRHLWDAVVERLGHDGPVFAADTPGHGASPGA